MHRIVPPQSKVEVRALKRVRTSTSPYILYVTSLQRVYSNRSLFYGFAVACNFSTKPVLSAQLTEGLSPFCPKILGHFLCPQVPVCNLFSHNGGRFRRFQTHFAPIVQYLYIRILCHIAKIKPNILWFCILTSAPVRATIEPRLRTRFVIFL